MSKFWPRRCWLVSAASAFLLRDQLWTVAYLENHSNTCPPSTNHLRLKLVQIVFRCGPAVAALARAISRVTDAVAYASDMLMVSP